MEKWRKKKAGRSICSERKFDKAEEDQILHILCTRHPYQVGIERHRKQYLWTRKILIEFIRKKYKIKLSPSGLNKYLNRWGFPKKNQNQRPIQRCSREIQEWIKSNPENLNDGSSEIFWLSHDRLKTEDRQYLICATDNHRKEFWWIVQGYFDQQKQKTFLFYLIRQNKGAVIAIRQNRKHFFNYNFIKWVEKKRGIEIIPPPLDCEIRAAQNDANV